MFIGHFGLGFAAKKLANKPSLGTLLFAAQFVDLLWPIFLISGFEKVIIEPGNTTVTPLNFIYYPFTHSLIGDIIWALLFGIVYYIIRKDIKISVWLGILVLSHWILDLITHRSDLPLFITNNSPLLGLGLWNSIIGTIIIEGAIFILGVYLFLTVTKPRNKIGTYSLWSLIIFLILIYITNLTGPPPPSVEAIGYVGLAQWLIVGWGYWIDKHRILARE